MQKCTITGFDFLERGKNGIRVVSTSAVFRVAIYYQTLKRVIYVASLLRKLKILQKHFYQHKNVDVWVLL